MRLQFGQDASRTVPPAVKPGHGLAEKRSEQPAAGCPGPPLPVENPEGYEEARGGGFEEADAGQGQTEDGHPGQALVRCDNAAAEIRRLLKYHAQDEGKRDLGAGNHDGRESCREQNGQLPKFPKDEEGREGGLGW